MDDVFPESSAVELALEEQALAFIKLVAGGSLPVMARETEDARASWIPASAPTFAMRAKACAALWSVMSTCHTLLRHEKTATLREAYYVDASLFGKQDDTNRAVHGVCGLLNVPRHCLGLRAAARGLVCGPLVLRWSDGFVDARNGACTIPPCVASSTELELDVFGAVRVLVVEKECIAHRLIEDGFPERFQTIVITGKGFPDLPTRALVWHLSERFNLPSFGLCDCGPYGLAVLTTYQSGSETPGDGSRFHASSLQWIGLTHSDAISVGLTTCASAKCTSQNLTKSDISRAHSLLASPRVPKSYHTHLQDWLTQNTKFELEALLAVHLDGLEKFVLQKLQIQ